MSNFNSVLQVKETYQCSYIFIEISTSYCSNNIVPDIKSTIRLGDVSFRERVSIQLVICTNVLLNRIRMLLQLPVRFSLSEPAKSTKWNLAVNVSYCSGASASTSLSVTSWSAANRLCLISRVKTAWDLDEDEFMFVAAVVLARAPARSAPRASLMLRTARMEAPTTRTPPQPSSVILNAPCWLWEIWIYRSFEPDRTLLVS